MRATAHGNSISGLARFYDLLLSLTWRDIRVRYKQSVLGIAWAVLVPLSMMLVFTFVFTRAIDARGVLNIEMPYALFAYSGLVPWAFFSAGLSGSVNSLVSNRNLVTKVYFPREVFPLSCVGSAFVDFCIAMVVLFGLIIYFDHRGPWIFEPSWAMAFLPVVVGVQILFTVGLGLLLAMGNLFYRDVRQIFGASIQLLMFVSGVVVPLPSGDSLLARIIAINPIAPIINAYRDCIIFGQLPDAGPFLYASAVSVVTLGIGWILFRRASFKFAECI